MEYKDKLALDMGRRNFLRQMGYLAGGAALLSSAPWLTSCTPEKLAMTGKEVARIALIGTGSRGQYHIHNLFLMPHAKIVALCDIYDVNLQAAAALCPDSPRLYTDYHKLLEDKQIDGVIISTPLGSHAQITLDALSAGKHV